MVTASFYNDEKWDGGRSASKFILNFSVRCDFFLPTELIGLLKVNMEFSFSISGFSFSGLDLVFKSGFQT